MNRDRALAAMLLFVSGGCGLVYELVWSNHLAQVLGNSGQAHSIVLATFMGGLALGAFVFGRRADVVKRPLMLYGILELCVGAYAVGFGSVYQGLHTFFLFVAAAFPESMRAVPKLVTAAMSLLLPTMLMGGTLPAMLKFVTRSSGSMRLELSRLYAVNSLGAALGIFTAGTLLVPHLGLTLSARIAASFNVVIAVIAILYPLLKGEGREPKGLRGEVSEPAPEVAWPAAARAAFFGVVLSGFTSMLLELAWIRLLAIVLGASAYAFTLILTAFILGIGLGSYWIARRSAKAESIGDARSQLKLFGNLQLGQVLGVCLTLPLYIRLPHYFWVAHDMIARTERTWPVYQAITFGFSCLVLLIPTFFLGAAFPVGARVAMAKLDSAGKRLGSVYAFNTIGTIAGSLLGGLVLLPAITMERCFALALLLTLAGGAVALYVAREGKPARALFSTAAVGAVVVIFLIGSAGWSHVVGNMGAFREYGRPFNSYRDYVEASQASFAVDFYADDTFATVVAGHSPKHPDHQMMRINGKIDASTDPDDVQTQILAGHLGPLLMPARPKRVLVIGAGAAITAGATLTHESVERLDLVEISPAVLEGAKLFSEANHHALTDPRTRLHVDDAKTFLALEGGKYDLIISVPSNPWVTGVSGLFTREFFQTMREHLTDDGVLVQWVHLYQSNAAMAKLVIRTMRETFPYSTTWGGDTDLVFVTPMKPFTLDYAEIEQRLAQPKVHDDLQKIEVTRLATLLAKQMHSDLGQKELAGEGAINTDDFNILEYQSPKAFFLRENAILADERAFGRPHERLFFHDWLQRNALSAADASEMFRNLDRFHQRDDGIIRATAERWLELAPDDPAAHTAAAEITLGHGDGLLAERILEGIDGQKPWVLSLRARTKALRDRRSVLEPLPGLPVIGPYAADPSAKQPIENECKYVTVEGCP
ncbi:MAG: spermidine synthase [Myxococcaceae bacterium]